MTDTQEKYIIVTSVKNEEANLSNLIRSIVDQTLKPILWVIIDDGSTDNTPEIIKKAQENYSWIHSIRMNRGERDIGLYLASVIRKGFDIAIEYCKRNGIDYEYLGNVDGDLTLQHTFFENLIKEFENDPELGIASGGTNHIIGDRIVHAELRIREPSGGHMLIRKKCFEDCGGIPLTYAWDSVLKAKARLRGWSTKRFEENVATEIRDVSSAEGYWKGFVQNGKASYYLNLHPVHVIIRSVIYPFRRSWYTGIAYLVGYFSSVIKREEKIDDKEVRKYFWNKWKSIYKQRLFGR
ncbi:glycosyltransferase family 2 protein [candidate division WOR-3 bacterium]|nr:glycosyltransferase family 2 protein [candidate division WOR-3 bacterium]